MKCGKTDIQIRSQHISLKNVYGEKKQISLLQSKDYGKLLGLKDSIRN